jgi:hypothetical protein
MTDKSVTARGQLFKIIVLLSLLLGRFAMMAFWNREEEIVGEEGMGRKNGLTETNDTEGTGIYWAEFFQLPPWQQTPSLTAPINVTFQTRSL